MYKKIYNSTCILRISDNAVIPSSEGNADWQAYQDWLVAGNVAQDADAPSISQLNASVVTQIVTLEAQQSRAMREILLGIDTSGTAQSKLQDCEQAIAALRNQLQS